MFKKLTGKIKETNKKQREQRTNSKIDIISDILIIICMVHYKSHVNCLNEPVKRQRLIE